MKTTIIKITVAAMMAGSAGAAMFPPREGDLVASIPFSFRAGEKAMAPGEYLVRASNDGTVEVCEDGVYCATLRAARDDSHGKDICLPFEESGDQRQMIGLFSGPEAHLTARQSIVRTRLLLIDRFAGKDLPPAWR